MQEENTLERLMLAVETLASSADPIQSRLGRAHLYIVPLLADDFPCQETKAKFERLLSRLQQSGEDSETFCKKMTDGEAESVAREIVGLCQAIVNKSIYGTN